MAGNRDCDSKSIPMTWKTTTASAHVKWASRTHHISVSKGNKNWWMTF
jgi:hypothetical protein